MSLSVKYGEEAGPKITNAEKGDYNGWLQGKTLSAAETGADDARAAGGGCCPGPARLFGPGSPLLRSDDDGHQRACTTARTSSAMDRRRRDEPSGDTRPAWIYGQRAFHVPRSSPA